MSLLGASHGCSLTSFDSTAAQNPLLGFPSHSVLSFASLSLVLTSYLAPRVSPVRKSASWIIGVHKVWYSVSNFYSKNSPLQQPCSHGAFRFTSAPHKIRYTLSRYSFVLVSTLILSPLEIKNGTFTTAPVSSVAGFVPP